MAQITVEEIYRREFIAGFKAGEAIANHIKMRISNSESEGNDHDNT